MNGRADMEGYLRRLEAFRNNDIERETMVVELVKRLNDLQIQFDQKCIDYEDAVESRRTWQAKAMQSNRDLGEIQRATESNQFIFAIIDGDNAYFRDDLMARGSEGGEEAAQKLHADIKSHIRNIYPESNIEDWGIIVQVALNLTGLSKALFERGIVKSNVELPAFARAFSCSQALFSFVDVGPGKERADHKVREMLRVMMRVTQCRHIIFGPCLDKGYLPVLTQYKGNPSTASKITLLETVPAGYAFRSLGFHHVDFPDVFRSEPLPERLPLLAPVRPASTAPDAGGFLPGTPQSTSSSLAEGAPLQSWAAVGKSGPVSKTINIANAAPKKPARPKSYLINANGERLDEELPRWDPSAEKRFANRVRDRGNCCNYYHLQGSCPSEDYCEYYHGDRLGPAEHLVLRHKARCLKCVNGTYCTVPDCFFGHHCRFGRTCNNPTCRFADTHHVDTSPATKVYEDGTVETVAR